MRSTELRTLEFGSTLLRRPPKDSTSVGMPFCWSTSATLSPGSIEHRYPALVEVLQQLSVVGGELDHVAGTVRAKCSTICSAYLRMCSSQLVE
jgi:hypothetical protein